MINVQSVTQRYECGAQAQGRGADVYVSVVYLESTGSPCSTTTTTGVPPHRHRSHALQTRLSRFNARALPGRPYQRVSTTQARGWSGMRPRFGGRHLRDGRDRLRKGLGSTASSLLCTTSCGKPAAETETDISVMLVVGHVEGRQVARCIDVATRGGGGATQRHGLSTCHPDGAPVLLEEDAGRNHSLFGRSSTH